MNNKSFQESLDLVFDKFHSAVRSTTFADRASIAASVGLLASSYLMATMPVSELPYLDSGSLKFAWDAVSMAAAPAFTVGLAAYSKLSLTSNSLTWLDAANGYTEPEPIAPKPVEPDGFIKRQVEKVERSIDYDNWDGKGFRGALKQNLEEFKAGLRAVSLEDAGVYAASVLVAATIFDAVVMKGVGAPITELAQSGVVDYVANSVHQVTEIFNKNIMMVVNGLSALAGAKALVIGLDKKSAEKAADESNKHDGDAGPDGNKPAEPEKSAVSSFLESRGFSLAGKGDDIKSSVNQDKGMRM